MKVCTLTLNPCFDLHLKTEGFAPFRECRAEVISRDAGGKGINLSRAYRALGGEAVTVTLVSEEDGGFVAAVKEEGLDPISVVGISGGIRENITLHEEGMADTRISTVGGEIKEGALSEVEELLLCMLSAGDILAVCGSIPRGLSQDRFTAFLERMAFARVRLVLDTSGLDPRAIPRLRPFLMKPNEQELSRYVGDEASGDPIRGAGILHAMGVENAFVTLGAEGAVLACPEGAFRASCPKVEVRSTVGAGDSSIAGFLRAFTSGEGAVGRIRTAVAVGSAACLTDGTAAPEAKEIERLLPKVEIQKIK